MIHFTIPMIINEVGISLVRKIDSSGTNDRRHVCSNDCSYIHGGISDRCIRVRRRIDDR